MNDFTETQTTDRELINGAVEDGECYFVEWMLHDVGCKNNWIILADFATDALQFVLDGLKEITGGVDADVSVIAVTPLNIDDAMAKHHENGMFVKDMRTEDSIGYDRSVRGEFDAALAGSVSDRTGTTGGLPSNMNE